MCLLAACTACSAGFFFGVRVSRCQERGSVVVRCDLVGEEIKPLAGSTGRHCLLLCGRRRGKTLRTCLGGWLPSPDYMHIFVPSSLCICVWHTFCAMKSMLKHCFNTTNYDTFCLPAKKIQYPCPLPVT